jgi:hypothetical protein
MILTVKNEGPRDYIPAGSHYARSYSLPLNGFDGEGTSERWPPAPSETSASRFFSALLFSVTVSVTTAFVIDYLRRRNPYS